MVETHAHADLAHASIPVPPSMAHLGKARHEVFLRSTANGHCRWFHADGSKTVVEGDTVATIGENRKMVLFPLAELPEMGRGRGVRLQRYKDGGLSDAKVFDLDAGLSWSDPAGRTFTLEKKELADWRGKRADAGRLAPKGFPKSNKFR